MRLFVFDSILMMKTFSCTSFAFDTHAHSYHQCDCVESRRRFETSVFGAPRLSAPRSSWSTSTMGCGSRRGRRACSCTRGRTPGCWPRRRPCRRCGSCGSGTPCGKRCGGELEASSEGKRESGGREIFVRRVDAPVRLGDLFVGGSLEDGRASLFFVFSHVCACVRGSGAVRVRRARSDEGFPPVLGAFFLLVFRTWSNRKHTNSTAN